MAKNQVEVLGYMDYDGNRHRFDKPLSWGQFEGAATAPDFASDVAIPMEFDGLLIRHWTYGDKAGAQVHWVYEADDWNDWDNVIGDIDEMVGRYGNESA